MSPCVSISPRSGGWFQTFVLPVQSGDPFPYHSVDSSNPDYNRFRKVPNGPDLAFEIRPTERRPVFSGFKPEPALKRGLDRKLRDTRAKATGSRIERRITREEYPKMGVSIQVRIGIHTSISKSLENAALKAAELGCNTFQIFSASPRMWKAGCPDSAACRAMQKARSKHDLAPLVIHDNYLINLGSSNAGIRAQSVAAFRGELERAVAIGAEYLVTHPGNYKGYSMEEGLLAVVQSLAESGRGLKSNGLTILLENTVGSGAQIGSRFEELEVIRQLAQEHLSFQVGFCLDTCHLLASGYDVATAVGLSKTIRIAESVLGLHHVHVIHSNDSKAPLNSRVDRHQHIGEGYIGLEGFRRILNHPKLRQKAFILETPIDKEGDDRRNVETLKSLAGRSKPSTEIACRKSRTITKKSS